MVIEDIPKVNEWLSQFDKNLPDRYLARYLLKKMRFVSFEEVEEWLQSSITELLSRIIEEEGKKAPIAIFPVAKPFINTFNAEKESKPINDSAGRIAHSLKNLERRLPAHVELTPRDKSMYERKVKHIIFVDDFIGTGERFVKSWRSTVSRRIKSWCSLGWCKIWILTFAGHKSGISHIVNQIRPADRSRIISNLNLGRSFIIDNVDLVRLAYLYGSNLAKSKARLGYGALASPIIFQHGCPNNTPGIFWSNGKKWDPLFPDRSVPSELYTLFHEDMTAQATPEELWMVGHYDLALSVIDKLESYRGDHQLIMILGYLSLAKKIEKIRNVLVLTDREMSDKLGFLRDHGLVGSSNELTQFGLDILKRARRKSLLNQGGFSYNKYYYPASFLGFQREV